MRLFSDIENSLLEKFVQYKRNGKLQELQVARLLRKELEFIALRWEVDPKPTVDVYAIHKGKNNEALKLYFQVVDFIYFVQELADNGFVKLLTIPSDKPEKLRELYDREKYTFDEKKNQFQDNTLDTENGILSLLKDFEYQLFDKHDGIETATPLTKQTLPNSFAYDLDKLAYCIIYPMPVLEDYVDNKFRTIEDKRYEENHAIALLSNKIANRTLMISAFALIISAIGCCFSYQGYQKSDNPTVISPIQISHLDSIIQIHSLSEPIKIEINDTLKVINIQPLKPNKK